MNNPERVLASLWNFAFQVSAICISLYALLRFPKHFYQSYLKQHGQVWHNNTPNSWCQFLILVCFLLLWQILLPQQFGEEVSLAYSSQLHSIFEEVGAGTLVGSFGGKQLTGLLTMACLLSLHHSPRGGTTYSGLGPHINHQFTKCPPSLPHRPIRGIFSTEIPSSQVL